MSSSRVVAALAPILLIGAIGGSYLFRCINFLLSPGRPVILRHGTPGGVVTITATSFALDPETRRLTLHNLKVTDPAGVEFFSTIRLRGQLVRGVPNLTIDEADLVLERLEDGDLALSRLSDPEGSGDGRWAVECRQLNLTYIDRTGEQTLVRSGALSGLRAAGGSGGLSMKGIASSVDFKNIPIKAHVGEESGLWLAGEFDNIDLMTLKPITERWVPTESFDLKTLTAGSLRLTGAAQVTLEPDSEPIVEGDLRISGTNVEWDAELPPIDFSGSLGIRGSQVSFRGTGSAPGLTASFDGGASLADGQQAAGSVTLQVTDSAALWPEMQALIPEDLGAAGVTADGVMAFDNGAIQFQGDIFAEETAWTDYRVEDASAKFEWGDDTATIHFESLNLFDTRVSGSASINTQTGELKGFLSSDNLDLAEAASRVGFLENVQVTGMADVEAVVAGTLDEPIVDLSVESQADISYTGGSFKFDQIGLRGSLNGSQFELNRLSADGPNGLVAGTGTIDLETKQIDLEATLNGLPISTVVEGMSGSAYASASVQGTWLEPLAQGRIEVYELQAGDLVVPQLLIDVRADNEAMTADSVVAQLGSGRLDGNAAWEFETDEVSGFFSLMGIEISDWVETGISGQVEAREIQLSGSVLNPIAEGQVEGRGIVAQGVVIDQFSADFEADSELISTSNFNASVGEGLITGSGVYAFSSGTGGGSLSAAGIPLDRMPVKGDAIDLDGAVDGQAEVRIERDNIVADLSGDFNDVLINQLNAGFGNYDFHLSDGVVSGSAQLGSLDRYVLLDRLSYDLNAKNIDSHATFFNFGFAEAIELLQDQMTALPIDVQDLLLSADGAINADFSVVGSVDDPSIDVDLLQFSSLTLRGREAGIVELNGTRNAGAWEIEAASWHSPDSETGVFNGSGGMDLDGQLNVQGSVANFDLNWITAFIPSAPSLIGRADEMTVVARGTLEQPEIQASLSASIEGWIGDDEQRALFADFFGAEPGDSAASVNLTMQGSMAEDEKILVNGLVTGLGFTGSLDIDAPLDSILIPEDGSPVQPFSAELKLEERTIEDLIDLLPSADAANSSGIVSGHATITGTADDYELSGLFKAAGEQLKLVSAETHVNNFATELSFNNDRAVLSLTADGSHGGAASGAVTANWSEVDGESSLAGLISEAALNGAILFEDFSFAEELAADPKQPEETTIKTGGSLFGSVTLGGRVSEPVIGGVINLASFFAELPGSFGEPEAGAVPPETPRFDDLTINIAPMSLIDFPLGSVHISGKAVIDGTLADLNIDAPAQISDGLLDLPNAPITLEENSSLRVQYQSSADEPLKVELNANGTTAVTARSLTGQYERFNVFLTFRGNLLNPEGLNMDAYSEPPDLTKDQILGIIGQKQLVESLAGSVTGSSQTQLSDTIFSLAVPTLTSRFTQELASSLSLDYITLDYNAFDGAMFRAGKTVSPGLMLHGSRQLKQQENQLFRYDLRLTWRVPSQDKVFSRLRLGVGTDQYRPWKITFDWSRRF